MRNARFKLDDNSIRGTRFSPDSKDPYSVIRRKYTGFNFLALFLLTLIAMAPYTIKTLTWSFIGKQEEKIRQITQELINEELLQGPHLKMQLYEHLEEFDSPTLTPLAREQLYAHFKELEVTELRTLVELQLAKKFASFQEIPTWMAVLGGTEKKQFPSFSLSSLLL